MTAGLLFAIALMAQGAAPAAGPSAAEPPAAQPKAVDRCAPTAPSGSEIMSQREIVVCAQRPQGYRLNPDVLEASRAKRSGRPKRPERLRDNSCASVGPMGCMGSGAGIDLVGGAILLGTMAVKAARGENVGKMFITDPQPDEYQLYLQAKRDREAEEAEAAAKAKAKAAAAKP